MRIVFMGTPDFAVTALESLVDRGHEVVLVITQPDRPKGRGNKLSAPPVKEKALLLGLKVEQPQTVKDQDFLDLLKVFAPEVIVVVAYGRILPKSVLDLPPFGCINVHGSLLPKYRGAAPIQWAVLDGESETGVTIMRMDVGMDTGDILLKKQMPIGVDDTSGSMFEKLAILGSELLLKGLDLLVQDVANFQPQEEALATYAPMLSKTDEVMDWSKGAEVLHNQVRGMNPAPGAYTLYGGERLKIWQTQVKPSFSEVGLPGTIIKVDEAGFWVQTGQGCLAVQEVQPAGKKRMSGKQFLNGLNQGVGYRLGVGNE